MGPIGTTIVTVIGGVVAAVLTLVGVLRTQRVAASSNDRTAAMEGWKQWREDAMSLRKERDEDRAGFRAELAATTERIRGECEAQVRELSRRLDAVMTEHGRTEERYRRETASMQSTIDALVRWIRTVAVPRMRERGIPVEGLPPGVMETDPGGPGIRPVPII